MGELYYTAQRYFRNLGSVPRVDHAEQPGTTPAATQLDGFPLIRTWDDPIQYSCQKNFILGIGDIYTHADKNVPGATGTSLEPTKPTSVANDAAVDAQAATNLAFALQGLGAPNADNYSGRNNSAAMVGLAYWANVNDIRPDVAGVSEDPGLADDPDALGRRARGALRHEQSVLSHRQVRRLHSARILDHALQLQQHDGVARFVVVDHPANT